MLWVLNVPNVSSWKGRAVDNALVYSNNVNGQYLAGNILPKKVEVT